MASYRLVLGIIVGIILSFFTVLVFLQFFNRTDTIDLIKLYAESDSIKAATLLVGANFNFDLISFFAGTPTFLGFFAPELLAWIFIGFISGLISKGLKRGMIAGLLVVVITLLIWILLSIISGEDLMSLFQGNQLIETLGGIFSGISGALIGGLLGGLITGPYEELY